MDYLITELLYDLQLHPFNIIFVLLLGLNLSLTGLLLTLQVTGLTLTEVVKRALLIPILLRMKRNRNKKASKKESITKPIAASKEEEKPVEIEIESKPEEKPMVNKIEIPVPTLKEVIKKSTEAVAVAYIDIAQKLGSTTKASESPKSTDERINTVTEKSKPVIEAIEVIIPKLKDVIQKSKPTTTTILKENLVKLHETNGSLETTKTIKYLPLPRWEDNLTGVTLQNNSVSQVLASKIGSMPEIEKKVESETKTEEKGKPTHPLKRKELKKLTLAQLWAIAQELGIKKVKKYIKKDDLIGLIISCQ